jgi:hypothetical protein
MSTPLRVDSMSPLYGANSWNRLLRTTEPRHSWFSSDCSDRLARLEVTRMKKTHPETYKAARGAVEDESRLGSLLLHLSNFAFTQSYNEVLAMS